MTRRGLIARPHCLFRAPSPFFPLLLRASLSPPRGGWGRRRKRKSKLSRDAKCRHAITAPHCAVPGAVVGVNAVPFFFQLLGIQQVAVNFVLSRPMSFTFFSDRSNDRLQIHSEPFMYKINKYGQRLHLINKIAIILKVLTKTMLQTLSSKQQAARRMKLLIRGAD